MKTKIKNKEKVEKLVALIETLLDQVDYTNKACSITTMVGAVLSKQTLDYIKETLKQIKAS